MSEDHTFVVGNATFTGPACVVCDASGAWSTPYGDLCDDCAHACVETMRDLIRKRRGLTPPAGSLVERVEVLEEQHACTVDYAGPDRLVDVGKCP